MSYWHAHPGVALTIIEKLLNYSILTPLTVVDWALVSSTPSNGTEAGDSLAQPHIFELISNTIKKVTTRSRQVLDSPETDDELRAKETATTKDLFRAMNDALVSWAGGNNDEQMETGDGESDRDALVRRWGARWLRVFRRLGAIEETYAIEAAKVKRETRTEEDGTKMEETV